jgi:hypothetical protein
MQPVRIQHQGFAGTGKQDVVTAMRRALQQVGITRGSAGVQIGQVKGTLNPAGVAFIADRLC